ncbi:O-antigen ligase family protein [Staphylococcus sp. SS251]|nr:O-antigen ligase family protein [Staphylococcus singaporensis]MBE5677708.1 O-antigen ligase family protein [Staphylococcus singaporensis]
MKFFVLCAIISMNLFIVISTFTKEVLNFPIEPIYYSVMVGIALITVMFAVYRIIITQEIPRGLILLIAICLFYLAFYSLSPNSDEKLANNNIVFFLTWAVPAGISGIYIKNIKKTSVESFFKLVFFMFSIVFIFVILIPKLTGEIPSYINFGLMNYQNASYLSAFTVGLGIYFVMQSSVKHKWLYALFIFVNVPSVFIPGGRGGAILLILYALFAFVLLTFKRGIPIAAKSIMYILALSTSSVLIYYLFTKGANTRTFSYLQGGTLSLEGTSGRGPIYERGMYYIQQSPLIGYGPFNYYKLVGNIPHNIIIELLLSFGLLGFVIILILVAILIFKVIRNYDPNSIDLLVMFLAIYPITLLMFSSNYLVVSEFWFALFYFITKGRRRYD